MFPHLLLERVDGDVGAGDIAPGTHQNLLLDGVDQLDPEPGPVVPGDGGLRGDGAGELAVPAGESVPALTGHVPEPGTGLVLGRRTGNIRL